MFNNNLKFGGGVFNIPLFMADRANKLIGLVLEKKDWCTIITCITVYIKYYYYSLLNSTDKNSVRLFH